MRIINRKRRNYGFASGASEHADLVENKEAMVSSVLVAQDLVLLAALAAMTLGRFLQLGAARDAVVQVALVAEDEETALAHLASLARLADGLHNRQIPGEKLVLISVEELNCDLKTH